MVKRRTIEKTHGSGLNFRCPAKPGLLASFHDEALESTLGGLKALLTRQVIEAAAGVAEHYVESGDQAKQSTR